MPAEISPARRAAFRILRDIAGKQGNSDTLLHSRSVDALSAQDRNLCTNLVMGTLRWQRVLDLQCRQFFSRPNQPLAEDAMLALRMGAYQLLLLDRVPPHAAIFESVEWTKQSEARRQAGLVNAILRKVAALRKPFSADATLAYPEWMVARWENIYGRDACRKICEAGQAEPPTALRLLTSDEKTALAMPDSLKQGAFLAKARVAQAAVAELPAAAQIQDEGSQLVAELLGRGSYILDCCAAPGGKTAIIAANNPSAQIVACDIQPARLERMRDRMKTILPEARIDYRAIDAARLENAGPFDRILCDVPCSGTGTLSRNPEIRHRMQLSDLSRHAARQGKILKAALRLLAPGGRLLYATCSLEPEENEQVIRTCMEAMGESLPLRTVDLKEQFDQLPEQGIVQGEEADHLRETGFRNGFLRTIPGIHSCDGFFVAMIERA